MTTIPENLISEMLVVLSAFATKANKYEANHPRQTRPLRDSTQVQHRLGDFRAARTVLRKIQGLQ